MVTGNQIRAARGLLGWDATDLAERAGLSRETVSKIENNVVQARESSMAHIAAVFSHNGIEFTEHQGVRFKPYNIDIFEGAKRFDDFYDFMYQHLSEHGGDVCISVADERLLSTYQKAPDVHQAHMVELATTKDVTFRVLATESDFVSPYATYKLLSKQKYSAPTSFFAFGDCLALISFVHTSPPYVVLIRSAPLTQAYRESFDLAWANADLPLPAPTR